MFDMDNQSRAAPTTGRDLLTSAELAKAQRTIAELTNRAFSWTNLSNFTAKVTLLVFGLIWFGTFWGMLEPSFGIYPNPWRVVPQELLYGLITLVVAAGLAFACTVVPSIFWSSLIAQTPAAEIMNKLYAKYGRSGYVVAIVGALIFTKLGYDVFYSFLMQQHNIAERGPGNIFFWAIICTFLGIVFPAWALNKTTPRQWIDGMIQAREVARLQHVLQLEEMIGAAMLARADALLHADLMAMTFDERADNNRQLAAMMATAERRFNRSIGRIGRTFGSIHGMSLDIQTGDDDQIVRGYAQMAEVMTFADDKTGRLADAYDHYVELLPEAAPLRQLTSPPAAEMAPQQARMQPEERLAAAIERSGARLSEAKQRADAEKALLVQELERTTQPPMTAETVSMADSQGQSGTVRDSQNAVTCTTIRLATPSEWGDAYLICREKLVIPFNVPELATAANVSPSTADRYRKAWLEGNYLEATEVKGKYFWKDPD
jgi:hypothetical protein